MKELTKEERLALSFLHAHRTGVIASVTKDGKPHAATIYYYAADDFSIYFITKVNTKKYQLYKDNSQVAFVASDEQVPQTVQVEGTVEEVPYENQDMKTIANLTEIMAGNSTFTAPLTKLDAAKVVLMKITPTWLRFADFAFGHHESDTVFFEVKK
ncbi:MAG: pyridoxamine 5'-phosphate oxidase family protein [Patescibacteria group bacterium]|nr:pyridoxamine 5'-phosphate oxidase family protein [Patescibacteria group bacterium]